MGSVQPEKKHCEVDSFGISSDILFDVLEFSRPKKRDIIQNEHVW